MKTRKKITQTSIRHDGHRGSPRWLLPLTAVCLLAVPGLSSAQFHSEVIDLPTDPTLNHPTRYSVVRTIDNQYTVSYANDQVMQEFLLTRYDISYTGGIVMPLPCRHVPIPAQVREVRDIRVLEDYVYFCGKLTNDKAFIGYFPFVWGAASVTINMVEVTGAQTLWRMAVYKNSLGAPKVVAVGIGSANPYSDRVVVEVDGIRNPATTSCGVALLQDEVLEDVALVGNEVVLTGVCAKQDALCLRKAGSDNVLCPQLFYRWHYPDPAGERIYMLTAAATDFGTLSVAYCHRDVPAMQDYTRIRHFDIPSMQMVNSHEITCHAKPYIHEMAFVPEIQAPILLQDIPFPTGSSGYQSVFTPVYPSQTSGYGAYSHYHPGSRFWSVDAVPDRSIVSTGENVMLLDRHSEALPSGCVVEDKLNVAVIANNEKHYSYVPMPTYPSGLVRTSHTVSPLSSPSAGINCTNP